MNKEIDILLLKYFRGEASEEELCELDIWLSESEENETLFNEMTLLYQKLIPIPSDIDFDEDMAFKKFKKHIYQDKSLPGKRYKLKSFRISVSIAASIVLLIGVSVFFLFRNSEKAIQLASNNNEMQYSLTENIDITLAPESQILYKQGNRNAVELKGKAVFSVENSKKEKDFLVQAGNTYIKHIGTVFTVTAYYPDEPVIVEVQEGEVLFYTHENSGIHIKENDKGIYDPQTKQFTYISMKELMGEIIFVDAFLNEVIHALEIRYGVDINLAGNTLDRTQITVSFDKDESIENILDIIAETLSLNISIKDGKTYTLSF